MREATPKGWSIEYEPKPIPTRNFDWNFSHENYDPENNLCGLGSSFEHCISQIKEIEEEMEQGV